MGPISCSDICNLIQFKSAYLIYLPEFIKVVITQDIFFLKLAPLYSAHTELSIYAKKSTLMKISQQFLFLEQVTYYTIGPSQILSHTILHEMLPSSKSGKQLERELKNNMWPAILAPHTTCIRAVMV